MEYNKLSGIFTWHVVRSFIWCCFFLCCKFLSCIVCLVHWIWNWIFAPNVANECLSAPIYFTQSYTSSIPIWRLTLHSNSNLNICRVFVFECVAKGKHTVRKGMFTMIFKTNYYTCHSLSLIMRLTNTLTG